MVTFYIEELGCDGVVWIRMFKDWRALLDKAMNLGVPCKAVNGHYLVKMDSVPYN